MTYCIQEYNCCIFSLRMCALAALNDVRRYLSEEKGHVAVSSFSPVPSLLEKLSLKLLTEHIAAWRASTL